MFSGMCSMLGEGPTLQLCLTVVERLDHASTAQTTAFCKRSPCKDQQWD